MSSQPQVAQDVADEQAELLNFSKRQRAWLVGGGEMRWLRCRRCHRYLERAPGG
jgi:hypothetical protein